MAWYYARESSTKKVHYFRQNGSYIEDTIIGPVCSNVSLLHENLVWCPDPEREDYCSRCYARLSKDNPAAIIFRQTSRRLTNQSIRISE